MSHPNLNDRQIRVLRRLMDGWNLDRAGRDGFGGVMSKNKSKSFIRVSVSDMNALYGWAIRWNNECWLWEITEAGREAASNHKPGVLPGDEWKGE